MGIINITSGMVDGLRQEIQSERISPKRLNHILEVEKMAVRLGEIYLPEKINILRAAALLHDITKEYSFDMQVKICAEYDIKVPEEEYFAPKTFHAKTAAALIPSKYPDFADDEIISAVRWHTTGRAGMTLSEKIIYLADYIDGSRTFDDCVKLRNLFWEAEPQNMSVENRLRHLNNILIISYDMTVSALLAERTPISLDTIRARNDLICMVGNTGGIS